MTEVTQNPRRKRVWLIFIVVLLCAACVLALWRFARTSPPVSSTQTGAHWVQPESRLVKTQVNATGVVRLKSGAEVRVGAQVSGIVRKLFVTVGSKVQQGQIIAEIDSRPTDAKVQQARAQLAEARVTLSKAVLDKNRSQQLLDAGIISMQQFQDAGAALDAATASTQAAQSGVESASVDLAYVRIRASISGTVSSVSTQQGETVAASFATPTFVTIIQNDALEVVAMVDEADIGNVRPGETATFTTETWPDVEFPGTVKRIAPVATIISGVVNYEVVISIRRNVAMLKPDMTSNVNIVTAQRQEMLIPEACVHKDVDGSFVYLRSGSGPPLRHSIVVGNRTAGEVEIVRGLDTSAQVIEPETAEVKR
jgi:RND family efflux transporter MFP subunit